VLREAWRFLQTRGRDDADLRALLQPPADYTYTLDSTVWPLRVNYSTTSHATKAQQILAAAETSWSVQIDWGWYQPPADGDGLYRFYIDDASGAAAYTAPYEENPETPWADCFTYIVVDPMNGQWEIPGVMAHEINHSMQAAMDCVELVAFWENTATYMMAEVFPDAWFYATYTLPYFQSQPWKALSFMSQASGDAYEYGGALLLFYLTDRYAPTDGPIFTREIWEASMQDGWSNEPDYYDAIGAVIASRDPGASFDRMFMDFSESRFFIASNDDGQHLSYADQLDGAEVTVTASHGPTTLPLRDVSPPTNRKPQAYGSNHLRVDLPAGTTRPVVVGFDGDDETRWGVQVVRFGSGLPTLSQAIALTPGTWDGTALVDPTGYSRLLLVVGNLGKEGYDPDPGVGATASYRYGVEVLSAPPTLLSLTPATVERGTQNVVMRLVGSGFVEGPEFSMAFTDPSLQIVSIVDVGANAIELVLTVPGLTEVGPKTLTVTNRPGVATSADLLTVTERVVPGADAGPGADDPDPGCGCRTSRPDAAPILGLLLGLLLLRRRRRA
jgi:MYXO-CTERM domain-containing protein